tara:strand:+ start:2951 stop:3529 length:579 start_codon:yes stop_codon:yes gene_type:complete
MLIFTLCLAVNLSAQTEKDSLYIDLNFKSISKVAFTDYLLKDVKRVTNEKESDSTFFKKRGLTFIEYCDQICESGLKEDETGKELWIAGSFDLGALSISFSKDRTYLLVCSSYDGSDYDNYYDFRADINIYKVTNNKGLKGIQPYLIFQTKDYSIEDIVWVNKNTLAIKIYTEDRTGNGENLKFKYLKTSFK